MTSAFTSGSVPALDDALMNTICTNMEPIRVIEREGFLQFVNVAIPGYKLPSRDGLREVAGRQHSWTATSRLTCILPIFTRLMESNEGARIRCECDATLQKCNIAD
ncbi:hypothetical protein MRX96_023247 [Rhipicephalus microplus]